MNNYTEFDEFNTAIYFGDIETCKTLLSKGANINTNENYDNTTPLHSVCARIREHTDICKLFLEQGANVHATNKKGYTPLHYASEQGHFYISNLLIDAGANVNAMDEKDNTPFHLVVGNTDGKYICKLLLEHGADINAKNKNGETPLHIAAANGCVDMCYFLVENGASLDVLDIYGRTPLDHGYGISGNMGVCYLLYARGARVMRESYESPEVMFGNSRSRSRS